MGSWVVEVGSGKRLFEGVCVSRIAKIWVDDVDWIDKSVTSAVAATRERGRGNDSGGSVLRLVRKRIH